MTSLHGLIPQVMSSMPSNQDLANFLTYGRIAVPWVTGIPYILFLVRSFLWDDIVTLVTTGQRVGLLDWHSTDSSYLN